MTAIAKKAEKENVPRKTEAGGFKRWEMKDSRMKKELSHAQGLPKRGTVVIRREHEDGETRKGKADLNLGCGRMGTILGREWGEVRIIDGQTVVDRRDEIMGGELGGREKRVNISRTKLLRDEKLKRKREKGSERKKVSESYCCG